MTTATTALRRSTVNSLESYDIYEAVDQLRLAALEIDDCETATNCALALGYELYDSETAAIISIADAPKMHTSYGFDRERFAGLGDDLEATANYVYVLVLSLNEGTDEGHVRVGGRRVYAA